jgi:hypothetical protein
MLDVAKRLCTDSNIPVDEIHTYHWIGDEMRFMPVYKAPSDGRAVAARAPVTAKASVKPAPPKAPARPASTRASAGHSGRQAIKPAGKKPAAKAAKKIGRSTKRK